MNRKIVFPTNEPQGLLAKRGSHFGRSRYYTLIEIADDGAIRNVTVVSNPGHTQSGCDGAVDNICGLGADALIVSGIGGNPLRGFSSKGLDVFYDGSSETVHQSLQAFIDERLARMQPEMSCSH